MEIDPRSLRSCLGHFASGVTVVSCHAADGPHGATVNAFTAVSLDPPLVLVSLDRRSKACRYLDDKPFTVNMLTKSQDDVAMHFAGRPMGAAPEWVESSRGGPPRLAASLAWLECKPWRSYDGGDHVMYVGEVQQYEDSRAEPLVFYLGAFRNLGNAFETVPWLESGDCPGISWFALAS
jgi:flavin reductase (DIM6/NTAB) family NADH-FMN oxidoreductase RutF